MIKHQHDSVVTFLEKNRFSNVTEELQKSEKIQNNYVNDVKQILPKSAIEENVLGLHE